MMAVAKPGPSSAMVTTTVRSSQADPTVTRLSAKSTAFSTRMTRPWMIAGFRRPDHDLHGEGAVGLDHVLDELRQGQALQMLVALPGERGQAGEDVAAAL